VIDRVFPLAQYFIDKDMERCDRTRDLTKLITYLNAALCLQLSSCLLPKLGIEFLYTCIRKQTHAHTAYVKFSLCLTKRHAMKTSGVVEV
jgi:hypothetical protein